MLFSKSVANQRQTAWLKLLTTAPSSRKALRPVYMRYIAGLDTAEQAFLETTEDERDAAIAAQTAAHEAFQKTIYTGEAVYKALMDTLPETDEVARTEATAAYHNILRTADNVYSRAVGPTATVLKALEARAMVVYEVAARKAFDAFESEMKAAIIEPIEHRGSCHAGSDRFVLQEKGGER